MRKLFLAAMLFSLLPVLSAPASAGCVSCGTGGECFDVSEGFSGNCGCFIRNRQGVVICTPVGVCDPNQPGSCDDDEPWVNASLGQEISSKFLVKVSQADPLLAGALWGSITEEISPKGLVVKRWLVPGEHTGTMGRDGASYRYTVQAEQLAANAFSVSVRIEEEGSARLDRFEGVILEKGRTGTLDRVGEKGRSRVVAWNSRDREK